MAISGSYGGTVPYKAIFCGDIPLHKDIKIGLIFGRYLQSIGSASSWPLIKNCHSCHSNWGRSMGQQTSANQFWISFGGDTSPVCSDVSSIQIIGGIWWNYKYNPLGQVATLIELYRKQKHGGQQPLLSVS